MRAYLPDYRVLNPRSLREAFEAMASGEDRIPLAGGTDLMVSLENGTQPPGTFLNLQAVPELARPILWDQALELGALTTYRDVRRCPKMRDEFPLLVSAACEIGVLAIQSRGTWAGNIANASPAADGVPALMVYDAEVLLESALGRRWVPLADFYHGYKKTERRPDELITAIRLPRPTSGWMEYFRKIGARRYQAISKVVFAGRLRCEADGRVKDARIAIGSVYPYTLRLRSVEAALLGRKLDHEAIAEANRRLQAEIRPIDDLRSTAAYRRRVASNLLRDFLRLNSEPQRPPRPRR